MTRRGRGRPPHPDILTPAEWRVLEELRTGGTYAEIAVRLGVSPDAIRFHVRNMRAKLNLSDRAELVAWSPPDGERRRLFHALLAPLAALPSVTRTLAGVAAVTVAAGAIVAAIVLVAVLGSGGGSPSVVAVPDESTAPTGSTGTPAAGSTLPAERTPARDEASPTPPSPAETPTPSQAPATTPAVANGECAFDFRDVFDFWVTKPEYVGDPEVNRTPVLRWIGYPPVSEDESGTGIRVHRLIATGSVRGVDRAENLSDGRAFLVLEIEVEDVLWGVVPQGTVVRILLDGNSRKALDWQRVEAARQDLLCSRALFANLWPVGHELAGLQSDELQRVSIWDIALGPRGDPFIDELAQAFRLAALEVQPRACPLFSIGTGNDVAVRPPRGRIRVVESSGIDSASVAVAVTGSIVGIAGEASVAEHVSQGALAERYLVFDVLVGERLAGELEHGDRLHLVLPVAATVSLEHVASLLPCHGALLLLREGLEGWLRVSLPESWVPLYALHDWGLYLETAGGNILTPYVSWASWDWMLYGPMMIYGVNVQHADLAEFSAALRGALADR